MRSKFFAAATAVIVVTAVAGCGAQDSDPATDTSAPATAAAVPVPTGADLEGEWAMSGEGYEQGAPAIWEDQKLVVEEADGQGFAGYKEWSKGEEEQKEDVNGVISHDGNVLIVDTDGSFHGRLIDGKLQGQYAEFGDDAAAMNLTMQRP